MKRDGWRIVRKTECILFRRHCMEENDWQGLYPIRMQNILCYVKKSSMKNCRTAKGEHCTLQNAISRNGHAKRRTALRRRGYMCYRNHQKTISSNTVYQKDQKHGSGSDEVQKLRSLARTVEAERSWHFFACRNQVCTPCPWTWEGRVGVSWCSVCVGFLVMDLITFRDLNPGLTGVLMCIGQVIV